MSRRITISVALAAASLVSACAATADPASTTTETGATSTIDRSTTTTVVEGDLDPMDQWIESAVADLSSALQVEPDSIEVLSAAEVTWRDGSLGCPVDGQFYTQALVPGYRIVLAAENETFSYHGAEGSEPALCESPEDPVQG